MARSVCARHNGQQGTLRARIWSDARNFSVFQVLRSLAQKKSVQCYLNQRHPNSLDNETIFTENLLAYSSISCSLALKERKEQAFITPVRGLYTVPGPGHALSQVIPTKTSVGHERRALRSPVLFPGRAPPMAAKSLVASRLQTCIWISPAFTAAQRP